MTNGFVREWAEGPIRVTQEERTDPLTRRRSTIFVAHAHENPWLLARETPEAALRDGLAYYARTKGGCS